MKPRFGIALVALLWACDEDSKSSYDDPGRGVTSLQFDNGVTASGVSMGTQRLEVTAAASIDGCAPSADFWQAPLGIVWRGGLVLPSWDVGATSTMTAGGMVGANLQFSQVDAEAIGPGIDDKWTGTVELLTLSDSVVELALIDGELCLADATSCESVGGIYRYEGGFTPATEVAKGVVSGWTDETGNWLCYAAELVGE